MLFVGTAFGAGELSRSRAELKTLSIKIDDLQRSLNANIASEKSVTSALDQLEFEQSQLRKEIKAKQAEKGSLESVLQTLEVQSKDLFAQSENAKSKLGGLLKSGYILGKQSALRMFVNQQNPHTAARRLTMFNYVVEARNKQLLQFAALQASLKENKATSEQRRIEMAQTIAALDAKNAKLMEKEALRLKERDKLKLAMADNSNAISEYRERQKSLAQLIKQLTRPKPKPKPRPKPVKTEKRQTQSASGSQSAADQVSAGAVASANGVSHSAAEPSSAKSETAPQRTAEKQVNLVGFGKAKGRLPRPLSAKVAVRFGDKKQESGLRWDGVLFNAKDRQAVKAIYPGQVVFSDWFRGYGQLMVLDHGEGYMSLYGHNQQLKMSVGDQVQSGQTIATASDASERPLPGLYFEIRRNGSPDDPLKWIK